MHRSFKDFKRFMDESDLSPSQVGALMRLHHGGPCGVSDIASHLGISNAAASQMVDRMFQMGLLARAENPLDRRIKLLTITTEGKALVEAGINARRCWMESLTTNLTIQQQEMIAEALTMLTEAARRLEEDPLDPQPVAESLPSH